MSTLAEAAIGGRARPPSTRPGQTQACPGSAAWLGCAGSHGAASTHVRARLDCARPSRARPANHAFEPPPGVPRHSGKPDPREVIVHRVRLFGGFGLDRGGFEFIRHESAPERWEDYLDPAVVLTAHTAFDDPHAPAEAPPRRSIELRTRVPWQCAARRNPSPTQLTHPKGPP